MKQLTEREQQIKIIANTVRALHWQVYKQIMATVDRLGLTVPQFVLLGAIKQLGGRSTMSDLIRITCQTGATLTGIVDRLVSAGLVARERDETDRRVVYVLLTEAGREKLVAAEKQEMAHMLLTLADISSDELEQIEMLLNKVLAGFSMSEAAVQAM